MTQAYIPLYRCLPCKLRNFPEQTRCSFPSGESSMWSRGSMWSVGRRGFSLNFKIFIGFYVFWGDSLQCTFLLDAPRWWGCPIFQEQSTWQANSKGTAVSEICLLWIRHTKRTGVANWEFPREASHACLSWDLLHKRNSLFFIWI